MVSFLSVARRQDNACRERFEKEPNRFKVGLRNARLVGTLGELVALISGVLDHDIDGRQVRVDPRWLRVECSYA